MATFTEKRKQRMSEIRNKGEVLENEIQSLITQFEKENDCFLALERKPEPLKIKLRYIIDVTSLSKDSD